MEIITHNKVKLIQWLCGEELILQHVRARNLVTQTEYIKVKSIQDPSANITELLDIILKKGDSICVAFLELLKNDDVNESRPELKDWITTVDTSEIKADFQLSTQSTEIKADFQHSTQSPDISVNITGKSGSSISTPVFIGSPISNDQEFLKKNRGELIDKVKNVERITDDLHYLTDEMEAIIQAERSDKAKMRKVLEYTYSKKAAKLLVDALYKHAKDVMENLITD
ncbi:hypothetical protein Q7C36_008597 [Tachysurus vachellii]|uniref:CARD domain-containing protein n=1 Tax=Tachysurus vachellii TaxID=175792 RepID=A0AA88N1M6_TACVA|nr:hypothetical protein Q7C36_008597 [Tachysurus vachellii]